MTLYVISCVLLQRKQYEEGSGQSKEFEDKAVIISAVQPLIRHFNDLVYKQDTCDRKNHW